MPFSAHSGIEAGVETYTVCVTMIREQLVNNKYFVKVSQKLLSMIMLLTKSMYMGL